MMEIKIYAFLISGGVLIGTAIWTAYLALKRRWSLISQVVLMVLAGIVMGYSIPSDEPGFMLARFHDTELMIEISIRKAHAIIGAAVVLALAFALLTVRKNRAP